MAATLSPLSARFKVESAATFMRALKEFGDEAMPHFKDKVGFEQKQFVAAAIVSCLEIENEDINIFSEAREKLKSCDVYDNYSLLFDRMVVLMNYPGPKVHGEARLLDPDGTLRRNIKEVKNINTESNTCFLDNMRQQFNRKFQHGTAFVICLFSYNLPCTESRHQCARLVDAFATNMKQDIIVANKLVGDFTDHAEAWGIMKSNERIYCVPPKILKFTPKKDSHLSLYDKVEEEPPSQRAKRRQRKRLSKVKPYFRNGKDKRKSFDRQRFNEQRI